MFRTMLSRKTILRITCGMGQEGARPCKHWKFPLSSSHKIISCFPNVKYAVWFPILIFRVEIICTLLANGSNSLLEVCQLDVWVPCFVVLLFNEVYGNIISVNFSISTYILNIHLLFYYIAHKNILSTSLMFMGKNFLSSKIPPFEFLISVSSKIDHIHYSGDMKIKSMHFSGHLKDHFSVS